ncbi:hypothetical protein TruAng_004230 [Truncatella angustata]|nr:hypothetical protein TruAng_004230 [Truncatella angustata]
MKSITSIFIAALLSGAVAQTLAPSPTESVGCEPHEDHWHCDGPVSTSSATFTTTVSGSAATITTATSTSSEHHDEEEHSAGTGSLAPSPTESVGCESHGDHWHCDSPASTSGSNSAVITTSGSAATTAGSSSAASVSAAATAGAPGQSLSGAILVGSLLLALGL